MLVLVLGISISTVGLYSTVYVVELTGVWGFTKLIAPSRYIIQPSESARKKTFASEAGRPAVAVRKLNLPPWAKLLCRCWCPQRRISGVY